MSLCKRGARDRTQRAYSASAKRSRSSSSGSWGQDPGGNVGPDAGSRAKATVADPAHHAETASQTNSSNLSPRSTVKPWRTGELQRRPFAAATNVSEATAGRHIMQARRLGFLGRTSRGRKGEALELSLRPVPAISPETTPQPWPRKHAYGDAERMPAAVAVAH